MQSRAWPRSNALEYLDAACGEKGPFPNRVRIALPYTAEPASKDVAPATNNTAVIVMLTFQ